MTVAAEALLPGPGERKARAFLGEMAEDAAT
jgi:hypothetical protein